MQNLKERDAQLKDKMTETLLKHVAEVASEEMLDEMEANMPAEEIAFSAEHEEKMQKLFESMEPKRKPVLRLKRVALLVAALLVILVAGVVALNKTKVLNFFMKTSDTNTEIRFHENEPVGDVYETEEVTLGYVPTGMQAMKSAKDANSVMLKFQKEDMYFQLRVTITEAVANLDTEASGTEKIHINEVESFIQEKDGRVSIKWCVDKTAYTLLGNLPREELIKIAENIR